VSLWEGLSRSFFSQIFEFLTLVGAFIGGLLVYRFGTDVLTTAFAFPYTLAVVASLIFFTVIFQQILSYIFGKIDESLPQRYYKIYRSHLFSFVPLVANSILVVTFISLILLALPMSESPKQSLRESSSMQLVGKVTYIFEKKINQLLGLDHAQTMLFLASPPNFDQSLKLNFSEPEPVTSSAEAESLYMLLNSKRSLYNAALLQNDSGLSQIAKRHGSQMLTQGYLVSRNELTAADTAGLFNFSVPKVVVEQSGISPFVDLAADGLSDTLWYRSHALSGEFSRVGIAALDTHYFGTLFVEIFGN
jgi:hypothetical protein